MRLGRPAEEEFTDSLPHSLIRCSYTVIAMEGQARSGVIYSITCKANGKIYIGSTIRSPRQRFHEHLHHLRRMKHHSRHLQHCFSKHGEDSLVFEIVEIVMDANFLLPREQFHIWRNEGVTLNSHPVADSVYAARASNLGRVQGEAERAMRSAAIKKAIDDGITKYSPWTAERRKAHGASLTGRVMPPVNAGRGQKISEALKGRPCPPRAIASSVATRTAFISSELPLWLELRAQGKSFRYIQKLTGRCRRVIERECARAANETGALESFKGQAVPA